MSETNNSQLPKPHPSDGNDSGGWQPARSRNRQNHRQAKRNINPRQPQPQKSVPPPLPPWLASDFVFRPQKKGDDDTVPLSSFDEPFMIILVGLPGSGKSTLAHKLQEIMPWKFVRINQDDLGNRKVCIQKTKEALAAGKCPIIDRCNVSKKQRKEFYDLAAAGSGLSVDCVVFTTNREVCVSRCMARKGHPTLAPSDVRKVMGFMKHDWQQPDKSEGFHLLSEIAGNDDLRRVLLHYAAS